MGPKKGTAARCSPHRVRMTPVNTRVIWLSDHSNLKPKILTNSSSPPYGKIVKVKASFKLPSVEKPKSRATATEGKKVPAKPKSVTKTKPAAKAKVAAKPKAVAKPKPKAKEKPAKVARRSPGKKADSSKPAPKKAAVKKVPAKSVKPKTVKSPGKKAGVKKGKK